MDGEEIRKRRQGERAWGSPASAARALVSRITDLFYTFTQKRRLIAAIEVAGESYATANGCVYGDVSSGIAQDLSRLALLLQWIRRLLNKHIMPPLFYQQR